MFSLQFNYKHLYIFSNKLDNDESDILMYVIFLTAINMTKGNFFNYLFIPNLHLTVLFLFPHDV